MDPRERHLKLLTDTIEAVNSTLDLEQVLTQVATKVADALHADACFVYLYDDRSGELVLRATHGTRVEEMTQRPRMRPGEGITGSAAESRLPVQIAAQANLDPPSICSIVSAGTRRLRRARKPERTASASGSSGEDPYIGHSTLPTMRPRASATR